MKTCGCTGCHFSLLIFPFYCIHNSACLTWVCTQQFCIWQNIYKYFYGQGISSPQLRWGTFCLDNTYSAYWQFLPKEFEKEVDQGRNEKNWGTESSSNVFTVVQQARRDWGIKARPSKAQLGALTTRPSFLKSLLPLSIAQKIGALN